MTGPFRGGTGGTGWTGAFTAVGDATNTYFDKLREQDAATEQSRQFDATMAANRQQIAQQQEQNDLSRFDRLDKSLASMETDLANRGKYMSPEQRQAYTEFIQAGRSSTQTYWATGDKSGFDSFTEKYGPGKAWGTDSLGNPITLESINADTYKNRPIVDMQEKMQATIGETAATQLSAWMADGLRSPERDGILKGVANGTIRPEVALGMIVSASKTGYEELEANLSRGGRIDGPTLAFVEDAMKTMNVPEERDADGKVIPNAAKARLEDLIRTHSTEIATFRAGRAITDGGKGTILDYQTKELVFDNASYTSARQKFTDQKSDVASLSTMVEEGQYGLLSSAAGKAEYFRAKKAVPGFDPAVTTDAVLQEEYNLDLERAKTMRGYKDKTVAAGATILGNQALQSTMTTDGQKAIFDALLPTMGLDAKQARDLEAVLTGNKMTEAQFTAAMLPTMLKLGNDVAKGGMLQTLATMPGGVGRAAIRAAYDAGMIDKTQFEAINGLAEDAQVLYSKGVNVAKITASADYQGQAVRKLVSDAMIQYNIPDAQAREAYQTATTNIVTGLVTQLRAEGMTPYAFDQGAAEGQAAVSIAKATVSDADLKMLDNLFSTGVLKGKMPYAGETGTLLGQVGVSIAKAQLSEAETAMLQGLFDRGVLNGKMPYADQIGASSGKATVAVSASQLSAAQTAQLKDLFDRGVLKGQMPYSGQIGQLNALGTISAGKASISKDDLTLLQNLFSTGVLNGQMPYAGQLGSGQATAQLSTYAKQQAEAAVDAAIANGTLPYASNIGRTQAIELVQKALTGALTSQYTAKVTAGMMPYAPQIGDETGRADLEAQRVRMGQAVATLDLLPYATAAQKQEYSSALIAGRYQDALNTLKTQRIDWDAKLQDAATLQGLAGMDPNGEMAALIKDPTTARMYLDAVNLSNTTRAFQNDLARAKADKTGTGVGGIKGSVTTSQLQTEVNTDRQFIKGVYAKPQYAAALDKLKKTQGVTVAADAVTGLYKIVVTSTDPAVKAEAAKAQAVLRGAESEVKPYADRISIYRQEIDRRSGLFGQPNGGTGNTGGGTAPNAPATGPALVPLTTPSKGPLANVPPGQVTGSGGVVVQRGGARAVYSGVPKPEISRQINDMTDHYLGKITQQKGNNNPWDNAAGPVRAYNGLVTSQENQRRYVNDIKATYDAKPWIGAIANASGPRKQELDYINAEANRIAASKGVDPDIIKALMWNESVGWQPGIPSSDGKGSGLGQVTGYFVKGGRYGDDPNYRAPANPVTPPRAAPPTPAAPAVKLLPLPAGIKNKYTDAGLFSILNTVNFSRVVDGISGGDLAFSMNQAEDAARGFLRANKNDPTPARVQSIAQDILLLARQRAAPGGAPQVVQQAPTAVNITAALPTLSTLGSRQYDAVGSVKNLIPQLRKMTDPQQRKTAITTWVIGAMGVDPTKMTEPQKQQAVRIATELGNFVNGAVPSTRVNSASGAMRW